MLSGRRRSRGDSQPESKPVPAPAPVTPPVTHKAPPAPQEASEIHKALAKGNLDAATISYVISLVDENNNEKDIKTIVYRTLVKKYKQKPGRNIYTLIKKLL